MHTAKARLAGAVLAGLASLLVAGWSIAWQVADTNLIAGRVALQIAPLPEGILPAGTALPPAQPVLSARELQDLSEGLWRDPLNPRLFNLVFANAVRSERSQAHLDRLATLLGQLGWRHTPALQNLILRALLEERFDAVLDGVDALLRRQRRPELAYGMLSAMEAIPQVYGNVIDKLVTGPEWRRDYLSVISPQSGTALLDARIRTLATLLDRPAGLTRAELAPSLRALIASGRGRAAHALWMRQTKQAPGGNLVYDPSFEQAAALAGSADLDIPFEWRLGQDLGYTAQVSENGVMINWDRRGVPIFLSQTVAVQPRQAYRLTVQGTADAGDLEGAMTPVLLCGAQAVRFEPMGESRPNESQPGEVRYRTTPLPQACEMGVLALGGALDSGSGTVNVNLTKVELQAAN